MKKTTKRLLACMMIACMLLGSTGCGRRKKQAKPHVQSTAEVKNGTAQAEGKGSGQSEVPLMVGCDSFDKKFNPFLAQKTSDLQAVGMTQVLLFDTDRTGRIVEKGIDGELQKYGDEDYTYYGIADVKKTYKPKAGYTVYRITIRDDLVFSDGEPITIDDVIFTLYALCDPSYHGSYMIGQSDIRGLLNYQTNSTLAESYTDAQVDHYIQKHPKKFTKWKQKHNAHEEGYTQALRKEARRIMAKKAKKKGSAVNEIEGIKRLNDYEMRIYTTGYDKNFVKNLEIPVCPLHYYGDTTKYQPEAGQFGFTKGDLSAVKANKSKPVGAGPYRFIKYESGIVYYMANELYYQGCPKITYLYLKDLKILLGGEAVTASAIAKEIEGGTLDIASCSLEEEDAAVIGKLNENDNLSGKVIETIFTADGRYSSVGINPQKVRIGTDSYSEQSVALRQGIATVITACRSAVMEQRPYDYTLTNGSALKDSWLSLEQKEESHMAYAVQPDGDSAIYKSSDSSEDKRKEAMQAALKWFEQAGYTIEEDKVTAAPAGASLSFQMQFAGGTDTIEYALAQEAAQDLQQIGITMRILTVTKEQLDKRVSSLQTGKNGAPELWYQNLSLTDDPKYGTRFAFLQDERFNLDLQKINRKADPSKRRDLYYDAGSIIEKQVVEVPTYQGQTPWLMSNQRIKQKKMTPDVTMFYDWTREIQNLEMKAEN